MGDVLSAPSARASSRGARAGVSKALWDAVVIGSGAGGSSIALRLAQHGQRVLVVERGDFLTPALIPNQGAIGRYLYDVINEPDTPLSFVGGQTKFYGGALYRLRESDFRATQYESGLSPAWPIGYAELEPYYEEAERLYRVHGALGGDPSEPPHASPYPAPPLPHDPLIATLAARLTRSGTPVAAIPRAIDYGAGGRCVLCATCDAYYCHIDAKMDAEIAALRPALASGNVRLLTRTECRRDTTSADGRRVTGVELRNADGTQSIATDHVVVAAGIPRSAALLRRARTERHREGLGNDGGALGHYLSGHSVGLVFPIVSRHALPAMHTKTLAINAYYDGAPGWPRPLGVIQLSGQMPFWRMAPLWLRPLARWVGQHGLTCFYATEALPTRESGFAFIGDAIGTRTAPTHNLAAFAKLRGLAVAIFRRAGYPVIARRRAPYLWHESGTACLGVDPKYSVVDPDCQVHGVKGLYVVDQSVLPSAGSVNTALTIIALALRAGDHIAGVSCERAAEDVAAPKRARDNLP